MLRFATYLWNCTYAVKKRWFTALYIAYPVWFRTFVGNCKSPAKPQHSCPLRPSISEFVCNVPAALSANGPFDRIETVLKCYYPSRTLHLGYVVVLRNRCKQVCFNTLKNDIFGSTIINYTSLTVNHRKRRRSCLQAIKPRFNGWIWGKLCKCILLRVHKTWSFYNIYFSINLLMGKPKSAVGKEKLAGSSDKGLLLLWLLSFNCYKVQYLLATVVFFGNVVALHFCIMTRKPTRFNTVNDLIFLLSPLKALVVRSK